jgi:hypothetical protein
VSAVWNSTHVAFGENKTYCIWEAPTKETMAEIFAKYEIPYEAIEEVRRYDHVTNALGFRHRRRPGTRRAIPALNLNSVSYARAARALRAARLVWPRCMSAAPTLAIFRNFDPSREHHDMQTPEQR